MAYDIGALIAGTGGITPPKFDFQSAIGNLPNAYWEGLQQRQAQESRDLFRNGIPGSFEDTIKEIARVKGAEAGPLVLNYYKQLFGQNADQVVHPGPQAATPSLSVPNPGNPPAPVVAGGVVPSSPKVMGDEEGVKAGLYDPAATPGARPQIQSDAAVPKMAEALPAQRVAQGFQDANPAAPVAPYAAPASDPTLGGLVPRGRTYEQQRALYSRAVASGMLSPDQAKDYEKRIEAMDKAISQYRENALKERSGIVENAVKGAMVRLEKSKENADAAAQDTRVSQELLSILDSGGSIFSGSLADKKLMAGKFFSMLGFGGQELENAIGKTESYGAIAGQRVAELIKAFGTGTAVSNTDLIFARKMAAGEITLDENSMRQILDISMRLNQGKIQRHNEGVDSLLKRRPELGDLMSSLKVDIPPKYTAPTNKSEKTKLQRYDSPSDVNAAIKAKKLKKGDSFLDSNGTTRYVP